MRVTSEVFNMIVPNYVDLSITGIPDLWSAGQLACCGNAATAVGCSLLGNPLEVSFCYCSCDYV